MTTATLSPTPTPITTPTPSGSAGEEEEIGINTFPPLPLHPSRDGDLIGYEKNVNDDDNRDNYDNVDNDDNNTTPPISCEEVKPQYGRGERTRNARMKIDYQRLAGETYSYDSSDEPMVRPTNNENGRGYDNGNPNPNQNELANNHSDDHDNNYRNRHHDYANKHVPEVIFRSYESLEDILQTIDDGSQLTVQNLVDPNLSLTIHRPILVTDTPESIGMKVPRGSPCQKSIKTAAPAATTTTTAPTIIPKIKTAAISEIKESTATDGVDTLANGEEGDNNTTTKTHGSEKEIATSVTTVTEPITIREIGEKIGMNHPVSVMDVKTQDEMEGWVVSDLVEYFEDEDRLYQIRQMNYKDLGLSSSTRTKKKNTSARSQSSKPRVLNQISLEFSNTSLRKYTLSPSFVRELDWIDTMWPLNKRYDENGHDLYPRVQYYCLTSTAGCYTDFHIDFGGTSVWYHVLSGKKVFLLMPPTKRNITLYESWLCSKNQGDIFFPDLKEETKVEQNSDETEADGKQQQELGVESCVRVTLEENQTFIIPTGWIHAVYTPVDSIVIGGNFVHGLDIKGQLDIHCLETRTRVPAKFRFPYFIQLMFYAGNEYYNRLKDPNGILYKEEVNGIETLVPALRSWAVGPGGDADREGSIAHVMVECVKEHQKYGIDDLESLLKALELGVEQLKKIGGEKRPPLNTANIVTSSTNQFKNRAYTNFKLKLSSKRTAEPDLSNPAIEVRNTPQYEGHTPKVVLRTGRANSKSKRQKIGDLASKHTVEDDEWLPGQRGTSRGKKRRKPSKNERGKRAVKNEKPNGLIDTKDKINKQGPRGNKKGTDKIDIKVNKRTKSGNARSRLKKKLGFS